MLASRFGQRYSVRSKRKQTVWVATAVVARVGLVINIGQAVASVTQRCAVFVSSHCTGRCSLLQAGETKDAVGKATELIYGRLEHESEAKPRASLAEAAARRRARYT